MNGFVLEGGFAELEGELDADAWLVDCPACGETVKRSRINLHRAASTRCRWQRARTEVNALWEIGYRNPLRRADRRAGVGEDPERANRLNVAKHPRRPSPVQV